MNKLRDRNKLPRNKKIVIICFVLMFITIGFAALSATLGIISQARIAKMSWNVHFEEIEVARGSITPVTPATINDTTKTEINFGVDFTTPGQYYEFDVDVVNSGTINAKLASISLSGIADDQLRYLRYSLKYADGKEIKVNDALPAGERDRIRVRLEVRTDINTEDLPTAEASLTPKLEVVYVQDRGEGVKRDKLYRYKLLNLYAPLDNMQSEYVASATGIDFGSSPSVINGNGLYVRAGTEEDEYPIFYYRGEVYNNNVLFANKCWKIVRTTETGGTKLIYNGIPDTTNENGICANTGNASIIEYSAFNVNYESPADVGYMYGTRYISKEKDMSSSGVIDIPTTPIAESEYINKKNDSIYPYTYDSSTNQWTSDTKNTNSAVGTIEFSIATAGEYYFTYDVSSEGNWDYVTVAVNGIKKTTDKLISGTKTGTIALGSLTTSDVIKVIYTKDSGGNVGRDNVIFSISKISGTAVDNRWLYGNSVTYSDGTYTLQNTKKVTWGDDISSNHYTCFSTENTCTKVNYIHYIASTYAYYVELTNGKTIENALEEMVGNSSNTTNSAIKTVIDTWFSGTNGLTSYNSYLEDTVWCNDRSIGKLGGWNSNGGSTESLLYFGGYGIRNLSDSTTLTPSLKSEEACPNKNDRFTLKSTITNNNSALDGNQKLDYPVGLLTADEATIAGHGWTGYSYSYLYTGEHFWMLSPYQYYGRLASEFFLNSSVRLSGDGISMSHGVRPAISLHKNVTISSGDGTPTNPYIVE